MTNEEKRLELQAKFEEIPGIKKVYFQPPESFKLEYDCILFNRDGDYKISADDQLYQHRWRYQVTLVTRDPDTEIPDILLRTFQYCSFDRWYAADNLNHYVFTLYY